MTTLDPLFLGILSLTSGLGMAMLWLGSRMNMLESRHTHRRCPSCGHVTRRRGACRCTA